VQNLTAQKVMLALITLGFFVASPWLTSETLSGNATPLISLVGVGLLLLFVYGLGDRCWMIIPFCLSIEGNLNFLPLNFSIQELTIIIVLIYLIFRMIFGLNVGWKLGPALLWVPLAGVAAVVFYHWISSGDIGIKLLGGTGWGGRKYFKVFLSALSIPLLASFPGIRIQDLQKVPLLYFLGTFVDIVPDLLTTFIPASAPYIFRVYSGVNLGEYGDTLKGNFVGEKGITRFGALAKLGSALGLASLCYFPARTWLSPNRLWVLPTLLIGGLLCAISGFRNTIFRYGVSLMAGLFAMMRFKALLLLPLVATAGLAIAATQGSVFNYPLSLQRALSFLPGQWEAKAAIEAKDSSKWREKMKTLFYKEYFEKAPLIGQGYHYDPNLAKTAADIYLVIAQRQAAAGDEFADVRSFIEQRQPHEGPVHILLVTGSVGAFFFVAYCLALFFYSFGSVIRTSPREVYPIQIWAIASLSPQILGFFIVFGDLTNFLIQVCPVSILLYRFERLKATATATPPAPLQPPAPNYEHEPSLHQPAHSIH
jgi:hypothetical protein